MRNTETCLSSLQKAILAKPLYWYLAQREQNFEPVKSEVEKLLASIRTQSLCEAENAIFKSETMLKKLQVI